MISRSDADEARATAEREVIELRQQAFEARLVSEKARTDLETSLRKEQVSLFYSCKTRVI